MSHPDAIVVGGGVIGCAVAYELARAGLSVALVERDRIGAHASAAAAGMLAPLSEGIEEGPLHEAGLAALERFPGLAAELFELSGIDPELTPSGVLRAAAPDEALALERRASRFEHLGCRWLSSEQARKREPRLSEQIAGALWSPREAHVHSLQLARAYAGAAARRGARLLLGTEAQGLVRRGDRVAGVKTHSGDLHAAHVAICTGAWTRPWEQESGLRLPVEPVRGQMLALESLQPPVESIVWGAGAYLVPRRNGTLLVGATVERVGFDVRTTAAGISWLLDAAMRLLPELGNARFLEAWAGLRPATPDGLPLIGPVPGRPGLSVAAGHFRNGVLLAPVTGVWLADWIARGEESPAMAAFDPGRFAAAD